jgi:hypothetical protein
VQRLWQVRQSLSRRQPCAWWLGGRVEHYPKVGHTLINSPVTNCLVVGRLLTTRDEHYLQRDAMGLGENLRRAHLDRRSVVQFPVVRRYGGVHKSLTWYRKGYAWLAKRRKRYANALARQTRVAGLEVSAILPVGHPSVRPSGLPTRDGSIGTALDLHHRAQVSEPVAEEHCVPHYGRIAGWRVRRRRPTKS